VDRRVGFAHRDGLMRALVPRKFTLVDAMVLIAATGIALVPIRYLLRHGQVLLADDDGIPVSRLRNCLELLVIISPLVVPWSAALCALRMTKPRPITGRIFRQPGTAACTAISLIAVFTMVRVVGSLAFWQFLEPPDAMWDLVSYVGTTDKLAAFIVRSYIKFGEAVAVVWIVLWLSGAWRSEPSWIDWSGRVLGIYCILTSILFGWSFGMIWN
jgi:hypothetical protein